MPIVEHPHNEGSGEGDRTGKAQIRLNGLMFWPLMLVIAASPIPLGSNRPLPWAVWAVVVGAMAIIYCVASFRRYARFSLLPKSLVMPALLMGSVVAYLIVQLISWPWIHAGSLDIVGLGTRIVISQITIAPTMTVLMLMRQLTYLLLFFLTLQILINDRRRSLFLNLLLGIGAAYALFGAVSLQLGDTILGAPKWAYLGVATGTFVNRNSFATYLAFGAVLAASLIAGQLVRQAERHSHDGRISGITSLLLLYSLAYAVLMTVVIATQSRMGLVAAILGTLTVAIIAGVVIRKAKSLFLSLSVLVVSLALGSGLFGGSFFDRLESNIGQDDTRVGLFVQTWELILQRPWTGYGGGSFAMAYPLVHDYPVPVDLIWDHAHNTYLTLWTELGLVFGSMPTVAVLILAMLMVRNLVVGKGSFTSQCAAVGAIVVGGVHSLADFSLEIQANAFMFVALIASGLAPSLTPRATARY